MCLELIYMPVYNTRQMEFFIQERSDTKAIVFDTESSV